MRRPSPATAVLGASVAVTVAGAVLASGGALPGEVAATELANDLPDVVVTALEVVMQLGARPAILLVAVVAAVVADGDRRRTAVRVVLAGALAWTLAVLVKETVERPRPAALGADVVVRDGADGFAYPSSHVGVATGALAGAALASGRRDPRRRLVAPVAVGAVVGLARMAVGVHLPLDVVGGLALGVGCALVAARLTDR